jgi:hypothetical protein
MQSGLRLSEEQLAMVGSWVEAGWGTVTPHGQLALTPRGWLRLDALAGALTADRSA